MRQRSQKLQLTWFNKNQALIPTQKGKYGYTWVDPKDPRFCETHTLITEEVVQGEQAPKENGITYSERADLDPTENNLLILGESGDVLEALTRVPEFADRYVGKVKCVYIDPPFNTAQTFANYEDNLEHSIWLTMMRDRLVHLRQLLSDDGSIWVHLDDAENHRMRLVLDEIFGAENFVIEFVWKRRNDSRNTAEHASLDHDYIIVYAKNIKSLETNFLPRTAGMDSAYTNPDNDPRGPWRRGDMAARNFYSKGLYSVETPSGRIIEGPPSGSYWRISKEELERLDSDQRIYWGPDGSSRPYIKRFLSDVATGRVPTSVWAPEEVGFVRNGKEESRALVGDVFSTPKPERLLERVIHIATNPGDIVLDIFGGSGTTAAVAHKMGRRWVTCELLEDTIQRFIRPRLEKVVRGEDLGGITSTKGERVDATVDGLPEGMSPAEAQQLNSLLNKLLRDHDELKNSPQIKAVKAMSRTARSKDTVNWRGGGSFRVARLSPSCFDYDPVLDLTTFTEEATGQILVESVAANLRFYLTPEDRHFDGLMGRQYLAVVEGVLDSNKVDDLMAHLPAGHTLLIAATIVPEGIREHVRGFKNGSRVVHIPLDMFTYTRAQEEK